MGHIQCHGLYYWTPTTFNIDTQQTNTALCSSGGGASGLYRLTWSFWHQKEKVQKSQDSMSNVARDRVRLGQNLIRTMFTVSTTKKIALNHGN